MLLVRSKLWLVEITSMPANTKPHLITPGSTTKSILNKIGIVLRCGCRVYARSL